MIQLYLLLQHTGNALHEVDVPTQQDHSRSSMLDWKTGALRQNPFLSGLRPA
jgi:hypothetical protein